MEKTNSVGALGLVILHHFELPYVIVHVLFLILKQRELLAIYKINP